MGRLFYSKKYNEIIDTLTKNGYTDAKFIGSKGFSFSENPQDAYSTIICVDLDKYKFQIVSHLNYRQYLTTEEANNVVNSFNKNIELVNNLNKLLDEALAEDDEYNSRNLTEYAKYEEDVLTAKDIMKELTWTSGTLYYKSITDASNIPIIPNASITAHYELNEDDLEVEKTNNVTYVYFNLDNLDIVLDVPELPSTIDTNIYEVLNNLRIVPTEYNRKAFRNDSSTYLMKINNNTGIISLFDTTTGVFKQTNYNYNNMTMTDIAKLLLTPEYIKSYLDFVATDIKSSVSLAYYTTK